MNWKERLFFSSSSFDGGAERLVGGKPYRGARKREEEEEVWHMPEKERKTKEKSWMEYFVSASFHQFSFLHSLSLSFLWFELIRRKGRKGES